MHIIVIPNLVLISLFWAYKHFIDKNRITDRRGNNRRYGWKEYSVWLGFIMIFNGYTFFQGDIGFIVYTAGYILAGIGFSSGGYSIWRG